MPIAVSGLGPRWPLPVTPDVDRHTRLSAAQQALGQLRAAMSALRSTLVFAMWTLQELDDPDASEAEQMAALDRLAQHIAGRWLVRDKYVSAELKWRMVDSGASAMSVKSEILKTALWLVLRDDINTRQAVRLQHGGWLVDDAGNKLRIVPDDLPFPLPFHWAINRAIKTAEAMLREQSIAAYEATREQPDCLSLDRPLTRGGQHAISEQLMDADANPLYVLLERETAANTTAPDVTLWQHATPAQQRLLRALLAQLEAGGSMTDGAITAAAKAVGISPSTARAQLHRLRTALSTSSAAVTSGTTDERA